MLSLVSLILCKPARIGPSTHRWCVTCLTQAEMAPAREERRLRRVISRSSSLSDAALSAQSRSYAPTCDFAFAFAFAAETLGFAFAVEPLDFACAVGPLDFDFAGLTSGLSSSLSDGSALDCVRRLDRLGLLLGGAAVRSSVGWASGLREWVGAFEEVTVATYHCRPFHGRGV